MNIDDVPEPSSTYFNLGLVHYVGDRYVTDRHERLSKMSPRYFDRINICSRKLSELRGKDMKL